MDHLPPCIVAAECLDDLCGHHADPGDLVGEDADETGHAGHVSGLAQRLGCRSPHPGVGI